WGEGWGEVDPTAEVGAGGIVDGIHVDRLPAGLRAQRVDERLADPADTGRLTGTPGEHYLDVRARLGRRRRDGRAQQRRCGENRDTRGCQETSDSATGHDSTPTNNCGVTMAAR